MSADEGHLEYQTRRAFAIRLCNRPAFVGHYLCMSLWIKPTHVDIFARQTFNELVATVRVDRALSHNFLGRLSRGWGMRPRSIWRRRIGALRCSTSNEVQWI